MSRYLPASANKQCITYRNAAGAFYLTASWPAPFFVLIHEQESAPLLIHCENRQHAELHRRGGALGAAVLDADFREVQS